MSSIKQLQEDVEILKIQNNKLQEELSYEKDERMKMSIILCDIVEKLKQNGITICEEKKEEIVEEVIDEEITLPPTIEEEDSEYIPDEKTPKSVEVSEEQEKTMKTIEKVLITDDFRNSAKTSEELIEQTEKFMKMTTMVDSFDELSDCEDFEESVDLQLTPAVVPQPIDSLKLTLSPETKTYSELPETIVSEQPELPPTIVDEQTPVPVVEETLEDTMAVLEENSPIVNTAEPPLPANLIESPMTPREEVVEEEEEQIEEENINYSKMKVGELKKLCKERGIKGYSKMKKKELIELLQ